MEIAIMFNKNDKDDVGNKCPALYVRFEDGCQNKFLTQDDLPRVYGLRNNVEIMDSEQNALSTFQVTKEFFQPYAAFCDDKMLLWHPNLPSLIKMNKGDIEVNYKDIENKWTSIKLEQ